MQTQKAIIELDKYLTENGYYTKATFEEETDNINTSVNVNWQTKIEEVLRVDLIAMLHNEDLQVKQTKSIFDIQSDEQGAAIFKSFLELTNQNETMDVVVNLNIYHGIAFIYLGGSHTHEDKYTGDSKTLGVLFTALKKREKIGQFFHSKFYDLADINNASTNHTSSDKPSTSYFTKWLRKPFGS